MAIIQHFFVSLVALSIVMAKDFTDEPAVSEEIFEQSPRVLLASLTCDKYPPLCRRKGSTGPDCCKKKCVDIKMDRLNCGLCGYKCKYTEICCKGKCVYAQFDKKNCGGCGIKCKKGTLCLYGMCNYA